jgi:hypothetical protein
MSDGFSLLSLTGSLRIHFKLIPKAKSETNRIVTGENVSGKMQPEAIVCQCVNAHGQKTG